MCQNPIGQVLVKIGEVRESNRHVNSNYLGETYRNDKKMSRSEPERFSRQEKFSTLLRKDDSQQVCI